MGPTQNRLSVREGMLPEPPPREGVPRSVEEPLRVWILETASLDSEVAKHAMIRLEFTLPAEYKERYQQELAQRRARLAVLQAEWEQKQVGRRQRAKATGVDPIDLTPPSLPMPTDPNALFLAFGSELSGLLDVVDDLLHALCTEPLSPDAPVLSAIWKRSAIRRTRKITEPLRVLLEESRSVYEIRPDLRGLRRRADVFLTERAERARTSSRDRGYLKADEHLRSAYEKLYALHADPSGAYVKVILAVEAVACPQFLPKDSLPTLGKVRAHLADAGAKYEFVVTGKDGEPGTTTGVIAMISMLWDGHSDRHEGGPASVPVSQEAAEVAMNITVALVNIFSRGAVSIRATPARSGRGI